MREKPILSTRSELCLSKQLFRVLFQIKTLPSTHGDLRN
jgi:hypothetical protein